MSRKLTKKEERIYEMLNKSFIPFKEKYQDIQGVFWELGGLNEKENEFNMSISIWIYKFEEKITKVKTKYAEKIVEDDLVIECFTTFMNELNNSGILSKIKLVKNDTLQLDYMNSDLPYVVEYIVYIDNEKYDHILHSIELNR
jgi:hypothetical protein